MLRYHQFTHLIKFHSEEILKLKSNKIDQKKKKLMTETCISNNRTIIKLKPNYDQEKQNNHPPKRTRKWKDFDKKRKDPLFISG